MRYEKIYWIFSSLHQVLFRGVSIISSSLVRQTMKIPKTLKFTTLEKYNHNIRYHQFKFFLLISFFKLVDLLTKEIYILDLQNSKNNVSRNLKCDFGGDKGSFKKSYIC